MRSYTSIGGESAVQAIGIILSFGKENLVDKEILAIGKEYLVDKEILLFG